MKYILFALLTCFPILLSAQTSDSISVAKEVDKLIDTCQGHIFLKNFEQALQCIETAKLKAEAGLGKMSAGYARCAHTQAVIYIQMGRFSDALPYCILAKDIREKILSKEDLEYSQSLSYLANLYKELGQYDKALPLALEAQEIRAIVPGKISREYGVVLHILANIYHKTGEYEKSESYYLESINVLAKKPGKGAQEYSIAVSNLAVLYFDMGKYDQVENLYIEAKTSQAKFPGKRSAAYAGTLNNLAMFYFKIGQYNKAEPLFLEARRVFAKVYGTNHEAYVSALTNLAGFYYEVGQYGKAELLFLKAKEIMERTVGKENRTYAAIIANLGVLYFDVGQYDKAEADYLEAKNILEKVLGKEHPDYTMALANLGGFYYKTEQYADAERYLLEANNIRQKVLGNDHPDYATSLHNLAELYSNSGQYTKAEPLFLKSKDIWAKTLGIGHSSYAKSLQSLAQLYDRAGDYGKAESLYLDAKAIFAKTLGKDHPNYAAVLNSLAVFYRSTNRLSESAPLLLELNAIDRGLIEKSAAYFSEKQMLAYLQTCEKDLSQFNSFVQVSPTQAFTGASFDNALFYNGFLLENASQFKHSVALADSLTRDTLARWQGCHRRLAKEYAKPMSERKYVAETEVEAEGYEKTLTRKLPTFREPRQVPCWQDVGYQLRTAEAAVEFIHYHYYTTDLTDSTMYAALVLLPEDTMPHFIPLFEERQLLKLLNRPGLTDETIIKNLYGNSTQFRDLFWRPLKSILRDAKTIYYSPAGLLHRINPAAILDESEHTLSERQQWVRVGSTRELVRGKLADCSYVRATDSQPTAFLFGGITYDMDSTAFAAANPVGVTDSAEIFQRKDGNFRYIASDQTNVGTRGKAEGNYWCTLPSTERETGEINTFLQGAGFRTEEQKGYFASEERFKQIGVHAPSPRILHVATHGFAYPDPKKSPSKGLGDKEPTYKLLDDPMLRSGLVMAGANFYYKNKRPLTNAEDGMLVAYEVRDLNLQNTELVVLSACQTGLGDVQGNEGVYGLQRAFRIAGAKFLIVSLWHVPDDQTQELMHFFYQNWVEKKESLRDAFYHAQQRLKEKEPNPYMWAGFVLIE